MQDFFLIPIQSFPQNPFFLISMNYTHEDIRYLSPFLSIVKHPITLASWGVYESHLDSLFYVHYPKCYSGLSYIFQFSTRGFSRRVFLRSLRVCLFPRILFGIINKEKKEILRQQLPMHRWQLKILQRQKKLMR